MEALLQDPIHLKEVHHLPMLDLVDLMVDLEDLMADLEDLMVVPEDLLLELHPQELQLLIEALFKTLKCFN